VSLPAIDTLGLCEDRLLAHLEARLGPVLRALDVLPLGPGRDVLGRIKAQLPAIYVELGGARPVRLGESRWDVTFACHCFDTHVAWRRARRGSLGAMGLANAVAGACHGQTLADVGEPFVVGIDRQVDDLITAAGIALYTTTVRFQAGFAAGIDLSGLEPLQTIDGTIDARPGDGDPFGSDPSTFDPAADPRLGGDPAWDRPLQLTIRMADDDQS
jgi:hypothetical protein